MSKGIEDRMKEAHKLLANAAGRLSGMIARKRINRAELAHAALFAREATVALDALRDGLPPPKDKAAAEAEERVE